MKLQTRAIWTNAIILLVFSVGWEFGGGSPVRFGKIYLFDQTLYVSELTRGVRQLDISNPSRPGDLGLVRIDGNHDIALRGTSDGKRILFADSYADLVVIDVTLPAAPQTVDRLKQTSLDNRMRYVGATTFFLNALFLGTQAVA
jgi:hypothetical protein